MITPANDPFHALPQVPSLEASELRVVEANFVTRPQELDLSLRAWAARGGLAMAAVLCEKVLGLLEKIAEKLISRN